jgi:LEA14-like dessication related protein
MALSIFPRERRREYARFLLAFVFLAFLMKIAGEFIHETGHALFVEVFGGRILGIEISVEWPFTLSRTKWELADPTGFQLAAVAVAGILFDTFTTITGQTILLKRWVTRPLYAISIFWLSFWSYLNSVVYLVVGAFHPFGDIVDLINAVEAPRLWIGVLGFVLLVGYSYSLSIILRGIFSMVFERDRASEMVSIFWVALHLFFVFVTVVRYGFPMSPTVAATVLVMIFAWSYISGRWIIGAVSRLSRVGEGWRIAGFLRTGTNDVVKENEDRSRRYKTGYIALFSIAIVSVLVTGYMVSQYVSAYSLIMKTDILVETEAFEMDPDAASLNLTVSVYNPSKTSLSVGKIEFDVKLNDKYIEHTVLREIPIAPPQDTTAFVYSLEIPRERWFTLDEAISRGKWDWSVTGTGYVDTMFGETLLRFRTSATSPPV